MHHGGRGEAESGKAVWKVLTGKSTLCFFGFQGSVKRKMAARCIAKVGITDWGIEVNLLIFGFSMEVRWRETCCCWMSCKGAAVRRGIEDLPVAVTCHRCPCGMWCWSPLVYFQESEILWCWAQTECEISFGPGACRLCVRKMWLVLC